MIETRQLADEVIRLRDRHALIRRDGMDPATLVRLLEEAASAAGIERQQLERIWPQPPQRVDDTDYRRHASQVILRDVALPQAVAFIHHVADSAASLNPDHLRLTAPREALTASWSGTTPASPTSNETETWNLEVTFSYLVFTPRDGVEDASSIVAAVPTDLP